MNDPKDRAHQVHPDPERQQRERQQREQQQREQQQRQRQQPQQPQRGDKTQQNDR